MADKDNKDIKADVAEALEMLAGLATLVGAAPGIPPIGAMIARFTAVTFGTVSQLLNEGASLDEALAAVRRVRHIKTAKEDARVDAAIAAKPLSVDPVEPSRD